MLRAKLANFDPFNIKITFYDFDFGLYITMI